MEGIEHSKSPSDKISQELLTGIEMAKGADINFVEKLKPELIRTIKILGEHYPEKLDNLLTYLNQNKSSLESDFYYDLWLAMTNTLTTFKKD